MQTTANTPRTDCHSPANFDPASYRYIGVVYFGSVEGVFSCPKAHNLLASNGWQHGNFANKGTCDHCGSDFAYGAVYTHKNGDVICIGHICSNNAFGHDTRLSYDMDKARKQVARASKKAKAEAKAAEFIVGVDGLEAALTCEHYIVQDIKAKLTKWGSISEKQIALVKKIDRETKARAVAQAIEASLPKVAVPTGKQIITGEIVGTKVQESQWGTQVKMIVRDERGFKVYGSIPASITPARRGDKVTFTATVEAARDDQFFGFFKRPTKASKQD